jgi:hypothetical protein
MIYLVAIFGFIYLCSIIACIAAVAVSEDRSRTIKRALFGFMVCFSAGFLIAITFAFALKSQAISRLTGYLIFPFAMLGATIGALTGRKVNGDSD